VTDRSDATILTLRFADGRGKRLEIEPTANGPVLVERILTKGGDWRVAGEQELDTVAIENAEAISLSRHRG